MKNLIIIVVTLVLFSCDNFFNEKLQGDYSSEIFFKTKKHAELAINATYAPLSFVNNNNRIWVFGDVASDDAVKGGGAGDQADIGWVDHFTVNSTSDNVIKIWTLYYEGITRANRVIKHVPNINMDKALKNRIIGEAKFLRAYYYFYLTIIFGKVPLVLEPKAPNELQIASSEIVDIYKQIEQDCRSAKEFLPEKYEAENIGRATKGAASALLTKAYIFQKKWLLASDEAKYIVDKLDYRLMDKYSDNFSVSTENNKESIFEIQHLSAQKPRLGSVLNQWFAPISESGYSFNQPSISFVDEFESIVISKKEIYDPRLRYTVALDGDKWLNGEVYSRQWSSTGYFNRKHQQPLSEIPKNMKGDADLNYVSIRYADVLLMYAEALNELNDLGALKYLNMVRKRARESYIFDSNLKGYPNVPKNLLNDITLTNQVDIRSAIRHERRVELGMEFHRFFDIIRYGETYANIVFKGTNFRYNTNKVFPIPESERDVNKNLEQNFRY